MEPPHIRSNPSLKSLSLSLSLSLSHGRIFNYNLLCLNFCFEAVMTIKRSIVLEVSLTQIQYNRQTVV